MRKKATTTSSKPLRSRRARRAEESIVGRATAITLELERPSELGQRPNGCYARRRARAPGGPSGRSVERTVKSQESAYHLWVARRSLVVSILFALILAAAALTVGQSARAGRRALPDDLTRFIAVTPTKVKDPETLPACHPMTRIYPSLSAGPANSPMTLNFSADPNPIFDGFALYGGGRGVAEGGGYPAPLQVLLHGTVGQKETFVLVREYNNAGDDTP